jgi:nucleoside-diphosphate-sugar epimerase
MERERFVGDGASRWPAVHVKDAARLYRLAIEQAPAGEYEGIYARLLSTDQPASSTITQQLLGWKPTHPGLIEDIEQGHYFI